MEAPSMRSRTGMGGSWNRGARILPRRAPRYQPNRAVVSVLNAATRRKDDGDPGDLARGDRSARHGSRAALLSRRARPAREARHDRRDPGLRGLAGAQAARGLSRLERGAARIVRRARSAALDPAFGRAKI